MELMRRVGTFRTMVTSGGSLDSYRLNISTIEYIKAAYLDFAHSNQLCKVCPLAGIKSILEIAYRKRRDM